MQATLSSKRPLNCRMQGVQGPLLRAQTRSRLPASRLHLSARCMANAPSSDDKSWVELAGDAFQLAKTAVSKASKGVSDAVSKIVKQREEPHPSSVRQDPYAERRTRNRPGETRPENGSGLSSRGRDLYRPDEGDLMSGLLGRAAGSMLGGVFGQLGEMVEASSQAAADAKQQALTMIQSDDEVRSALGDGIRLVPGMDSQSISTSSFNGRTFKQTNLGFLVAGSRGQTAQAQADVRRQEDGSETVSVTIRLSGGRVIRVSNGGSGRSGGSGATIDVDWKEVR